MYIYESKKSSRDALSADLMPSIGTNGAFIMNADEVCIESGERLKTTDKGGVWMQVMSDGHRWRLNKIVFYRRSGEVVAREDTTADIGEYPLAYIEKAFGVSHDVAQAILRNGK